MKTVFVSSTFRDFQSERDALHNQVLPRLKEQARAYGESVDFCDLRWGVDTSDAEGEEESSARVLTVCMNEIDRSRPHMLVLLGERYGFMPGSEAIRHEMARKAVDLEDLEISVTALEVEYGALHNPEGLSNTWFYFRELTAPEDDLPAEYGPESQRHREKLEALKARIKKVAGDRIRFYKAAYRDGQVEGLDDFVKMVQEDLGAQFAAEWSAFEQMHPYQKDALSQWNYLKSKAAAFSAFGGFAADLRERIAANRLTVVTGTAGSGKTTLFARVCMDMEAEGWNVVPFACGNTSLSTDGYGILKSLVWQLEELAGVDHIDPARAGDMAYMDPAHAGDMAYMDPAHAGGIANMDPAHAGGIAQMDSPRADGMRNMDSARTDDTADTRRSESTVTLSGEKKSSLEFLRDRLDEVCVLAEKKGRIVLAVDAVDQLAVGEMRDQLQFLPRVDLPEFRMFVTCLDSFRLPPALRPVRMPRLEESERETVVESILTTMGKELSTRVRRALTQKKQSDNPLYLYMAVSRLTLMDAEDFKTIHAMGDGMEAINAYQLSLIESMPEELPVLGVALVDAVAARVNPVMTDAAELIACTRHGLRLEDLRGILQETGTFSALEYAQFINFMSELFLLRSDGRYDFLHKSLRDGLKARTGEEKMREDHVRIAAWLEHLPEGDSVRIQELAWHLIQSDQKVKLLELISDRWSNELTPLMEATARALIEQSMSDGGAFMEETLGLLADCSAVLSGREEAGEISPERMAELIYHFVGLLARQMNDLFGRSVRELTVMRRVMESALTAAEQLTAEWPKEDRFPVVKSLIGRVLGECCLDQLSEESLRRALELFEDLVAAEGEKVNYTKVYLYTEMAKAAFNLETWEDIELASEYARKAIALIEDLEKSSGHKLGMESKSVLYAILAEIDEHLGTRESLEEALELLSQMEDWAEQDPETNKRTFANIFARKGMLLRRRRDEAGRAEGLAYYEKAVRLFREILLEEGDSSAVSNLARGYQMLGEAYIEEALRKEEKAYYGERGIALLRESIEIFDGLASKMGTRHVRNLAAYVRWNLAYAVEKLRGAREAEEIQREVVRLSAELAAENPLPILQANYATACGTLVRILAEQNIKEREEEALELAARTQRLCQENYEKYHMTEILRSESSVCYQVSRIYRRRGGRENLTAALEWEKRDLELMRELWRERGTETARTELYATLDSVIRILRDIGEADFLEEAAVLCREAVSLSEEIVKDQNTAKAREDLADTCELYGTVCRNRGGEEDKKEALFWFRRSLKEHEAVAGASDTRKTTESMQRLHREAGRICMGLGQEYLTDSLYHWQHAHDLAQLLCRESTLPGHKKAIGVACWGMGRTLEDMGGMENQYKALELFQKDLAIMEEVAREEPDWQEVRWDMGIAHSRIAIACQNLGEPGDYEQIFQDPAEVERRRTSGEPGNFRRAIRHYGLWQKIMEKLAEEGRENAEEEVAYSHFLQGQLLLLMALKAEKEWQEAAPGEEGASESSDVQDNETASLMMWTAEIVEDSLKQSREHLEACIDMYRRPDCCTNITEALRQERLSQSYDALEYGLRYLIALLYHDGDAQEDLETEEGYRAALSCYEREAKLEQRLMELHPDLEHRDALAMTYYRLSGVAKAIGGAYLEAALKWNALDLEESLVLYEEEPTAQRARNLATSWLRRARIYGQFHDDGYLPQILECNRKEYEYKNIAWVPSEEEKYTQRLSDAAYRVAKNLRKLGGAERLEEALRYNERDVELAELLLSGVTVAESGEKAMPDGQGDELEKKVLSVAEMEKRRGNLAVSLKLRHQILMDLFAQTGGEEYRVCALAACERALKLRTANAEANPSEKNLEKLETAKKELVEIQLSGV